MLLARKMMGAGKKTLYATSFSEYTAGAQPSDWTKPWGSTGFTALVQSVSGSISGKALRWTKTAANDFQLMRWDKVPLCQDVEVLFRFRRIEAAVAQEENIGVLMRGSGASSGVANGAKFSTFASDTSGNIGNIIYSKYTNGVKGTPVGITSAAKTLANNAWMWVRINHSGDGLKVKKWLATVGEPSSFDSENVVGSGIVVLGAGFTGLMNTTANPNVEIDYFAVDVAAKTIPLPI
jgi:hypothetical protein